MRWFKGFWWVFQKVAKQFGSVVPGSGNLGNQRCRSKRHRWWVEITNGSCLIFNDINTDGDIDEVDMNLWKQ